MDREAKGPTKGSVPLKISHQDGFTVSRTVTASPNFLRKAKEATKGNKAKMSRDKKQGKQKRAQPFVDPRLRTCVFLFL